MHVPAPPPPTGSGIAAEEEVHVSAATWAWVVGGRDVICPGSVEVSSSVSSDGRARRRQQLYHKFPLELAPRCQSASHLSASTPGPGVALWYSGKASLDEVASAAAALMVVAEEVSACPPPAPRMPPPPHTVPAVAIIQRASPGPSVCVRVGLRLSPATLP